MIPDQLAQAALTLVGAPFRLHGRDPATGLDCIGVLAAALQGCGTVAILPNAYGLRSLRLPDLGDLANRLGFARSAPLEQRGDVLFVRVCAVQLHLMIAVGEGEFVHAHAGLRRVVRSTRPKSWRIEQCWRLDTYYQ